jgi:hypothetical protein
MQIKHKKKTCWMEDFIGGLFRMVPVEKSNVSSFTFCLTVILQLVTHRCDKNCLINFGLTSGV